MFCRIIADFMLEGQVPATTQVVGMGYTTILNVSSGAVLVHDGFLSPVEIQSPPLSFHCCCHVQYNQAHFEAELPETFHRMPNAYSARWQASCRRGSYLQMIETLYS